MSFVCRCGSGSDQPLDLLMLPDQFVIQRLQHQHAQIRHRERHPNALQTVLTVQPVAAGNCTPTTQTIAIITGTSTVPLARMMPPMIAWKPNTNRLHNMMCSKCSAIARVESSVRNSPSNQCDNR